MARISSLLVLVAGALAGASPVFAADEKDPLLDALTSELERSVASLKTKGDEPLYYLSYRVHDGQSLDLSASYGALLEGGSSDPNAGRHRLLDVSVRVGCPECDNTH